MTKLIIGCGYLGSRLAESWRAGGEHVLATTRRPGRAVELAARGIEPIRCDVLDAASLTALPRVEEVVYCVGLDRTAGASMRQVYVEGLQAVLRALPGSPRLVYVSSTSVYGQSDGSWIDESAATEPPDTSGQVVLEAEQVLRRHRPDAVVLRFAGIYGPGRLLRARDLLAGRVLAIDAEKWLNLIHVEDGARALQAALARARPGSVVNVCDDRPVSRRAFYTRVAEVIGAPPPRFEAPPEPLPAADRVNRRILNRRMHEDLGVRLRFPDSLDGVASAVQKVDGSPTPG